MRFRSSRHSHRAKSRAISWQRYETTRNFITSAVPEFTPPPPDPCNPMEFEHSSLDLADSWRFVQKVTEDGTTNLVLEYMSPDSGGPYAAKPVHVFQGPIPLPPQAE